MLVFVALHTAASSIRRSRVLRRARFPNALHAGVTNRLAQARLQRGAEARFEASILVSIVPSLAQAVLDGSQTAEQAFAILDYAIDRALLGS